MGEALIQSSLGWEEFILRKQSATENRQEEWEG